jgi:hypothetical protein
MPQLFDPEQVHAYVTKLVSNLAGKRVEPEAALAWARVMIRLIVISTSGLGIWIAFKK